MTDDLPAMDGDQNCATGDPEDWFPSAADGEYRATFLCHGCPWLAPCRAYALANDVQGVWGGTTWAQRRNIRRRGNIVARPVGGVLLARTRDAAARRASRARRRGVA